MRFFFLRDENGHPIGCLATELHKVQSNSQIKYDMVQYAVSMCNPLDQFKREQARALAAGRLATQQPKIFITLDPKDPPGQIKSRILHNISRDSRYPQRARDAAQRWLITHDSSYAEGAYNAAVAAHSTRGPKSTDRPCPVCGGKGKHINGCHGAPKPTNADAHLGAVETVRGVEYGR